VAAGAMSACRTLDVLLGAGSFGNRRALAAATVVGLHTAQVTTVSRHEVEGGAPELARAALVATGAIAAGGALRSRRARSRRARALALGLLGVYAASVGSAYARAAREPSAARTRAAVGAGVLGLMPLQAALLA